MKLIRFAVAAALCLVAFAGPGLAANSIYPKFKEAAIGGGAGTDLLTCNVKAALVDSADYTFSATHEFLSDVPALGRVATSPNLTAKTVANGTFDSADVVFSAVTGDTVEAVILYCDTGVDTTSRLILFADTGQTGLPITPSGGDITYTVDAAGWFTL